MIFGIKREIVFLKEVIEKVWFAKKFFPSPKLGAKSPPMTITMYRMYS